jgi:hypothetical protein
MPDAPTNRDELAEHRANGVLHAQIRILLQALVFGLAVTHRRRDDEFAAFGLLPPSFERTLTQQIQLVFVQAAL